MNESDIHVPALTVVTVGHVLAIGHVLAGTTSMFEAAGFHRVLQTAARRASPPRWLMRRTF